MIHRRKTIKSIASAMLLCFTSLTGEQPLYAVPANTQLPQLPAPDQQHFIGITKDGITVNSDTHTMTIDQGGSTTSVIKWGDFSIGADAAVNFKGPDGFNSLNYVTNGPVSEIYGQLTALGGNIFIANPAGVQICNSAQINVGSLYVTNKDVGSAVDGITEKSGTGDIESAIQDLSVRATNAQLMSLGGIVSAGNVTFDGDRIVIDADRLYSSLDGDPLDTDENLKIKTDNKDNAVIGYTAYDMINNTYKNTPQRTFTVSENGKDETVNGYMWVTNLLQLQSMNTVQDGEGDLNGWFALRNSIDANFSYDAGYWYAAGKAGAREDKAKGFAPIGGAANKFTGRFDGLGFDIFDLNVNRSGEDYAGLFGYAENAIIRSFTLNSGLIQGGGYTGAAVGRAAGGRIENIVNAADVNGGNDTGGVIGSAANSRLSSLINVGTITGGAGTGGIAGTISGSPITGETYNLGAVTGNYNVGGVVGSAAGSAIGNAAADGEEPFAIYNQLNVTGGYNVGGVVGDAGSTIVQNTANHGAVLATGSTDESYSYHTARKNEVANDVAGTTYDADSKMASIKVSAANAGGIAGNSKGSSIMSAENNGDVVTLTAEGGAGVGRYYNAGNVGGIVGRAEDTTIKDVMNKENIVAGAHNVGGVAGYMAGASIIDAGINNGGEVTATGARRADGGGFALESVRSNGEEVFNIGNIGGVAGYMYGDGTYVANSANRGTVHSAYIKNQNDILTISEAANAGGIAGKIDRSKTSDADSIKDGSAKAAVGGSYNTGDVQGYTGVGGIAGFMYNGEITRSYNLGAITATRRASAESIQPLNMGGVVGDTTEGTDARALVYDVYNAGDIGDPTYSLYGRHVGGVVGRLSGTVEKAYNTGDIYNGFNVVGGIAGWWYAGGVISNVFNTGNITVKNNNNAESQVGGIAGAVDVSLSNMTISNAYNLGTLRSFREYVDSEGKQAGNVNTLGGIVGVQTSYEKSKNSSTLNLENVYTLGSLYAAQKNDKSDSGYIRDDGGVAAIRHTGYKGGENFSFKNVYYITPEKDSGFTTKIAAGATNDSGVRSIAYEERDNAAKYGGLTFSSQNDGEITGDGDGSWRIYSGSTPIPNAFIPNMERYFSQKSNYDGNLIDSIQYGTAYDPLLTVISAKPGADAHFEFDWGGLGITGAAGLAVYGNGSLEFDNFASEGPNNYFGGRIYSDGALTVNGTGTNFNLGSASRLYGSSVTLNADGGDITAYGAVTSVNGGVAIAGRDVEIIGKITAQKAGEATGVAGISLTPEAMDEEEVRNLGVPDYQLKSIAERFRHVTAEADVDGGIKIDAGGAVRLLYGHLKSGEISAGGDIDLRGGSIYMDTVFSGLGGDMRLTADGEALLDLSNIGELGSGALHSDFFDHFKNAGAIYLSGGGSKILAVDMWDYDGGRFNLEKYDVTVGADQHTLADDVRQMNVFDNGEKLADGGSTHTHIWISDAEQLKGIQAYYEDHKNDAQPTGILGYNFALKNDVDASRLTEYNPIAAGEENGFTGTFDGRGYAISGLTVGEKSATGGSADGTPSTAAIFETVGPGGTVQNLGLYASAFYGNDYAAGVAGKNKGAITGISTLGNHIEVFGSDSSYAMDYAKPGEGETRIFVGMAGGIAGKNEGVISDVFVSDSVVAGDPVGGDFQGNHAYRSTAGGVAGFNMYGGKIEKITADSAVTANRPTTVSLGGVAGANYGGLLCDVYSTGVAHGEYGDANITSDSVGGVAGFNAGILKSVYNAGEVTGGDYVGGVAGYNYANDADGYAGIVSNSVNASDVYANFTYNLDGSDRAFRYAGGLVGYNAGKVSGGRNTGKIFGGDYVGGMTGGNSAVLENLSNSVFAAITGENYVGGIAGENSGLIDAEANGLRNNGKIYGQNYVGGIAGLNGDGGSIANTISNIALYVKDAAKSARFFGGVAGQNKGTITNASNTGDVTAGGASYVGGIVGMNGQDGEGSIGNLTGKIINEGNVAGKKNVGGIAGINKNSVLLNRGEDRRLMLSNAGSVEAADGSAGGIFYENNDDMSWVELVNSGTVDGGSQSNTGGIFGVNRGIAENSVFTNSGIVKGTGNTGGLFGSNSGDFKNSSLFATVDAKVTGTGDNVGGLIGYNTGAITGGRTGADGTDAGYYKYQVYNNGSVKGANNVGGLIGHNAAGGTLTAAYNTGAVTATGKNAGGIAGNNEGSVSTVFNTIMTLEGNKQIAAGSVTGAANAGGLIGRNSGALSDAYNTTGVIGTANAGNAVGENASGGTISNIYATNTDGRLIGADNGTVSNAYSYASGDSSVNGVKVISDESARKLSASYGGFGFSGGAVWKTYEGFNEDSLTEKTGYSTPLLKVFLTKAEYKGCADFTYNAQVQGLVIGSDTIEAADTLAAYDNAESLLTTLKNKNAGSGYLALYSGQIAGSAATETDGDGNEAVVLNPNNLGYDIDATYNIGKALLTVKDIIASIVYGGNEYEIEGGTLGGVIGGDSVSLNADFAGMSKAELDALIVGGSEYDKSKGGRATADVLLDADGNAAAYDGSLSFAGLTLIGDDSANYSLGADTAGGAIKVTPAELSISFNNVWREYGNTAIRGGRYGYTHSGLANGDEGILKFNSEAATIADKALLNAGRTNDAGTYSYVDKNNVQSLFDGFNFDNYTLHEVSGGESIVRPKELSISDVFATIVYGKQDGNDFAVRDGTGELQGVMYNDDVRLSVDLKKIQDGNLTGAYANNRGERDTADAGVYADSLTFSDLSIAGDNAKLGNYTLNPAVKGTIEVTPASLMITLNDVEHNYGTVLEAEGIGYGIKSTDGLANGDDDAQLTFNAEAAKNNDNAIYKAGGGEWRTNDAHGEYDYLTGIEDAFGGVNFANYNVTYEGGKSAVAPKHLSISSILAAIVYGNQEGAGFKIAEGGELAGIAYDDDVYLSKELKIEDAEFAAGGAYENNRNGRVTADVAEGYAQRLTFSSVQLSGRHAGNYAVDGDADAVITVTPAQLGVMAHDKTTRVGREPEYTGTTFDELSGSLVNGDLLPDGFMHAFGIEEAEMLQNAGYYPGKIGAVVGGLYYYTGTHDWSGHNDVFANYDVNVDAGSLRVYVPVPDYPLNYSWLYDDAPYSRKWNFRERKAEIYFQDGGMEYRENM